MVCLLPILFLSNILLFVALISTITKNKKNDNTFDHLFSVNNELRIADQEMRKRITALERRQK